MAVRLPFSRFLTIFICFTYILISLVFLVQFSSFFLYLYENNFSHCYEHLLCNLLWQSSSYIIKQGFVFIFSNKSILDFDKYILNLLVHIPIHNFLCFATYGCCHPCFSAFSISFSIRFPYWLMRNENHVDSAVSNINCNRQKRRETSCYFIINFNSGCAASI